MDQRTFSERGVHSHGQGLRRRFEPLEDGDDRRYQRFVGLTLRFRAPCDITFKHSRDDIPGGRRIGIKYWRQAPHGDCQRIAQSR
jgi:hypothetical protein